MAQATSHASIVEQTVSDGIREGKRRRVTNEYATRRKPRPQRRPSKAGFSESLNVQRTRRYVAAFSTEINDMAAKKAKKPEAANTEVITAFKGFDKNLQCRGYQFEIGKTHTHEGEVEACSSGFHSCENPFDVLNYYPLISDDGSLNRFASVKASGTISRHDGDSKIASASLLVEVELKLPEFISAAITWIKAACKTEETAASGAYSKLAASGACSKLAASGNSSQLAASGYYSKLAASGHYSQLAASGDSSQLAASGDSSIVCAASANCKASAGNNGCIVLTRWVESEKRYRASVAYVGENGIKPNVFYELDATGEFVECEQ